MEPNELDSKIALVLLAACETALAYFEDTRHGREWIESGGMEAAELRAAICKATE